MDITTLTTEQKIKVVADYCLKNKANVELIGSWLWVSFKTKPDTEVLTQLKIFKGYWNRKRKVWQFAFNNAYYKTGSKTNKVALAGLYGYAELKEEQVLLPTA